MTPSRISYLFLFLFLLAPSVGFTQIVDVPKEFRGRWGSGKACSSSLSILVTKSGVALVNGKDIESFGVDYFSYSYFYGNGSHQGIMRALMPEPGKFLVVFNSNEKKGVTTIDELDESLRMRFPMNGIRFRKCTKP